MKRGFLDLLKSYMSLRLWIGQVHLSLLKCGSFLIILCSLNLPTVWANSEISGYEGTMRADYTEQTDSQSAELSGNNRALAYRSREVLSFLDLGLEWGTYAISGKSTLHEVEVSSDYVNLLAGISFHLLPKWIELTLDYGYRLGVDRVKVDRTTASGELDRHKVGGLSEEPFSRVGIRVLLGDNLFVGWIAEQQSQLFDKSKEGLYPRAQSMQSSSLILGYRFGGPGYWRAPIRSGKSVSQDPCLMHRICDPS